MERQSTLFYGGLVGPLAFGLSLGFYAHESKIEELKSHVKSMERCLKLRGISYQEVGRPSDNTGSRSTMSAVKAIWCKILGVKPVPSKSDDSQELEIVSHKTPEMIDALANSKIEIKTAPADIRFPSTNQTKHCFTRYVEYHRCLNDKGTAGDCEKFAKYYRSLCPGEWVEKWNEQRKNGTFPGPL